MRSPWVEAGALLAASGHALAPPPPPPTLRTRLMADHADFAFLSRMDATTKPIVFQSLNALADHIEGRRHGQAIQLDQVEDLHDQRRRATGAGEAAPEGQCDRGVQVWTLMLDGTRDRSLGYAWLKGEGRERLQIAMEAAGRRLSQERTGARRPTQSLSREAIDGVMP